MKDIANSMVYNTNILRPKGVRINVTYFQAFTAENTIELFDRFVIQNGFDRAKIYYKQLYPFDKSCPTDRFEVDWKPNLKINEQGEVTFKIAKNDKASDLLFVIQGFSNQGDLISEKILMD